MRLLRIYLSWARFHQVRWLQWRADRAIAKGIRLATAAVRMRRLDRVFLGQADPMPSARVPNIKRKIA